MISTNGKYYVFTKDSQTIFAVSLQDAPDPTKTEVGMFLVLATATLPVYVCDGTAWVEVAI